MFKKLLIPIDIAEPEVAAPAIAQAAEFANLTGGSVRLLYVRSLVPVGFMEFVPADFDAQQQADNQAELARLATTVPLPQERVSHVVRLGAVYAEVLAEADDCGADLIIVGSHRPGMATYLLGSNASTIVRHARSAVLVLRREDLSA